MIERKYSFKNFTLIINKLTIITILSTFNINNIIADENPLLLHIVNPINNEDKVSFYQKIKNFFSFSSKNEINKNINELDTNLAEVTEQRLDSNNLNSPDHVDQIKIDNTQNKNSDDNDLKIPTLSEENSTFDSTNSDFTKEVDQLKNDQLNNAGEKLSTQVIETTDLHNKNKISVQDSNTININSNSDNLAEELSKLKKSNLPIPTPLKSVNHINDQTTKLINSSEIVKNQKEDEATLQKNKFISDEAKVLLLPNDDVVLGSITHDAKFENMDYYNYIKAATEFEEQFNNQDNHNMLVNFIESYDYNFNNNPNVNLSDIKDEAFESVINNNLTQLKVLLDNYPIINIKDREGNNLLHLTTELNEYNLTKYLILRGVNILALNNSNISVLSVAEIQENNNIIALLKFAGSR